MLITVFQAVMDVLLIVLLLIAIVGEVVMYLESMTKCRLFFVVVAALISLYGIVLVGLHFYYLFW